MHNHENAVLAAYVDVLGRAPCCRHHDGTDGSTGAAADAADRNPFPPVSEPPADDESALAAASTLDESERTVEVNDLWWRQLNEVGRPNA